MNSLVRVAVPSPLYRPFDYWGDALPGARVRVPFGRREVVGVVLAQAMETTFDLEKIKAVIEVLDQKPVLSAAQLQLAQWLARYYVAPIGEVISTMLPKALRQGRAYPDVDKVMRVLDERGALTWSDAQREAIEILGQAQAYQAFLLYGVTGSGKTEVYLSAIERVVARGQQALVLVPEIGLTPQTVTRFEMRFGSVVTLHSGLTDKQRLLNWCSDADVVVGTRSALFAPLPRLGLIVVDESHDASYKQQSGVRYSARDVALVRAKQANVPVVLGTATPTLESVANVRAGKLRQLSLPARVAGAQLPQVHLIDVRGRKLLAGLSQSVLAATREQLQSHGQVLFYLNRRGYAPVVMCHGCGWAKQCHRCDAKMVLHGSGFKAKLHCHQCDAVRNVPKVCEQCGEKEIVQVGLGTERLEAVLQSEFPESCLVRIDRDTTRKKGALQRQLQKANTADILIGTQMLAKGHHFERLSLVVILDIDSALFSADFRALERLAQMLSQVAGRAGRAQRQGEVLIQTYQPSHPALCTLLQDGYEALTEQLLAERQLAALPPFSAMAVVRAEAVKADAPKLFLAHLIEAVDIRCLSLCLGPMEPMIERKAGRFRAQLILQAPTRGVLNKVLRGIVAKAKPGRVRWSIDVDPQEVV